MNQQSLAILLSWIILGVFLLAIVVIIAYRIRTGRIRKSPIATRREKNFRHLVTIATLGIGLLFTVTCLLIEPRIGGYFIFATVFFALFVAPIRTVIVEMGLRRTIVARPDIKVPSSLDHN